MMPDDLREDEEAIRDEIAALNRLSSDTQAPPDFLARVMAKADRLKPGMVDLLANWWSGWSMSAALRVPAVAVLVLVLLGAVPQYIAWYQRYISGVPSEGTYAGVQRSLWKANFGCSGSFDKESTAYDKIDLGHVYGAIWPCPSGDLLVELASTREPSKRQRIWIPGDPDKLSVSLSPSLIATAFAAERTFYSDIRVAQSVRVLCQKELSNGFIKRRIQLADGRCQDEVINPDTGKVEKVSDAPCDCSSFNESNG
jgi:hypothetical protein